MQGHSHYEYEETIHRNEYGTLSLAIIIIIRPIIIIIIIIFLSSVGIFQREFKN